MKNTIDSCKVKAGECGAVEAIVNAMKVHMNNPGVCYNGCTALCPISLAGK